MSRKKKLNFVEKFKVTYNGRRQTCRLYREERTGRKKVMLSVEKKATPYARFLISYLLEEELDENLEVHHIDGDRANDCIDNLELIYKDNHKEVHRQKNKQLGALSPKAFEQQITSLLGKNYV